MMVLFIRPPPHLDQSHQAYDRTSNIVCPCCPHGHTHTPGAPAVWPLLHMTARILQTSVRVARGHAHLVRTAGARRRVPGLFGTARERERRASPNIVAASLRALFVLTFALATSERFSTCNYTKLFVDQFSLLTQ